MEDKGSMMMKTIQNVTPKEVGIIPRRIAEMIGMVEMASIMGVRMMMIIIGTDRRDEKKLINLGELLLTIGMKDTKDIVEMDI